LPFRIGRQGPRSRRATSCGGASSRLWRSAACTKVWSAAEGFAADASLIAAEAPKLQRARCRLRVQSVVLTVRRRLLVHPDKQTFSESGGMSQRCRYCCKGENRTAPKISRKSIFRDCDRILRDRCGAGGMMSSDLCPGPSTAAKSAVAAARNFNDRATIVLWRAMLFPGTP
jgi:hypothetical protein